MLGKFIQDLPPVLHTKAYKYSKIENTIKGRILLKSCVFTSDLQFLIIDK